MIREYELHRDFDGAGRVAVDLRHVTAIKEMNDGTCMLCVQSAPDLYVATKYAEVLDLWKQVIKVRDGLE